MRGLQGTAEAAARRLLRLLLLRFGEVHSGPGKEVVLRLTQRRTRIGRNGPTKTFLLFVATALAEIVGSGLPYLWLKQGRSGPAAASSGGGSSVMAAKDSGRRSPAAADHGSPQPPRDPPLPAAGRSGHQEGSFSGGDGLPLRRQ